MWNAHLRKWPPCPSTTVPQPYHVYRPLFLNFRGSTTNNATDKKYEKHISRHCGQKKYGDGAQDHNKNIGPTLSDNVITLSVDTK